VAGFWPTPPWLPKTFDPAFRYKVKNLHLDSEDERAATRLKLGVSLQECFPEPLPDHRIHIVVQLPPPPSSDEVELNRQRQEEADKNLPFVKYIRESSYALLAPSEVAQPSAFQKLQNNEELRILNDRPHTDVQVAPIALLYPPFGEFLDHIRNPPMESDDLDLADLEAAVIEFSSLMCQHYDKEDERREKVLEALNAIFKCALTFSLTPITSSGDRFSAGHMNGSTDVLETIVEFTNELGSGETDPEIQLTAYYVKYIAEGLSGGHITMFKRFLFPALGISLMGKGYKSDLI
jgi:hypothetical protein